jgi:hypothetical protein
MSYGALIDVDVDVDVELNFDEYDVFGGGDEVINRSDVLLQM